MAYFAKGTEGLNLDEQCDNCLHGMNDGIMCPVAAVQMAYNYIQLNPGNEDLRAAMNLLIGERGNCQMSAAMKTAGVVIDLSGREQQELVVSQFGMLKNVYQRLCAL